MAQGSEARGPRGVIQQGVVNTSINIALGFFNHPKTKRLLSAVGRSGVLGLLQLWEYAGEYHSRDGKLKGYSGDEVENLAGWDGEKGKLLDGLEKTGWIQRDKEQNWCISNWKEHQGHIWSLKERGKKMARARWAVIKGQNPRSRGDADSITDSNAKTPPKQCSNQLANLLTSVKEVQEKKGGTGEEALNPPEIPSEQDVVAFGVNRLSDEIPEAYCRHYHRHQTKMHAWQRNGQLILWQHDLIDWWARDRHSYAAARHSAHPEFKAAGGAVASKSGPTIAEKILHKEELQRVEDAIAKIRGDYAGHQDWSAEDRAKVKKLKERREVLKKLIGFEV